MTETDYSRSWCQWNRLLAKQEDHQHRYSATCCCIVTSLYSRPTCILEWVFSLCELLSVVWHGVSLVGWNLRHQMGSSGSSVTVTELHSSTKKICSQRRQKRFVLLFRCNCSTVFIVLFLCFTVCYIVKRPWSWQHCIEPRYTNSHCNCNCNCNQL